MAKPWCLPRPESARRHPFGWAATPRLHRSVASRAGAPSEANPPTVRVGTDVMNCWSIALTLTLLIGTWPPTAWSKPIRSLPVRTSQPPLGQIEAAEDALRIRPYRPEIRSDPRRSTFDFTDDAGLTKTVALNIAFESDGQTVWVASANGVRKYDGYQWISYNVAEGLPSRFCRSVHVDGHGTVWVGTDLGVATLDRETNRFVPAEAINRQLAGLTVRRIRGGSDGSIWFCCDRWPSPDQPAGLCRLDPQTGDLVIYHQSDGLPDDHVYDTFVDSQGVRYALTSRGPAQFDPQSQRWFNPLAGSGLEGIDDPCWNGVESSRFGVMLISNGSIFVRPPAALKIAGDQDSPSPTRSAIGWRRYPLPSKISALVVTPDGRVYTANNQSHTRLVEFHEWDGRRFVPVTTDDLDLSRSGVWLEELALGTGNAIWVVAGSVLVRWEWEGAEWREYPGLPPPRFQDQSGRVWFVDERGATRVTPQNQWDRIEGFTWPNCLVDAQGQVWRWTARFAERWDDRSPLRFHLDDLHATTPDSSWDQLLGLIATHDGAVWAYGQLRHHPQAAEKDTGFGFRRWNGRDWRIVPSLTYADLIAHLGATSPADQTEVELVDLVDDRRGGLWILVKLTFQNRVDHRLLVHLEENGSTTNSVPRPRIEDIDDQFNYNDLNWFQRKTKTNSIFDPRLAVDGQGRPWLFGLVGLSRRSEDGTWERIPEDRLPGRMILEVFGAGGAMWFFTSSVLGGEDGLATFRNDSWSTPRSCQNLPNLLGRRLGDGTVILRIDDQVLVERDRVGDAKPLQLHVPEAAKLNSAVITTDGTLWLGDSTGARRYRGDGLPPRTLADLVSNRLRVGEPLQPQVVGIERFRPLEGERTFRFSWRLNRGPWSDFQETIPPLATESLRPGTHRLEVVSMDEGGDIDPIPALVEFQLDPIPLQERGWFLPVVGAVGITLMSLAFASIRSALGMKRAKLAAEAASQAKTIFLAAISHELRTPLNAVLGMTRLLSDSTLETHQREQVREIELGAGRLLRVLNDLIDFTALETGRLHLDIRPVRLHDLLAESLASSREIAAQRGLEFQIHLPARDQVRVVTDPTRLGQVIDNLAGNAVKYTLKGSIDLTITFDPFHRQDTLPEELAERVAQYSLAEARQADHLAQMVIQVRDTGVGIAPDRLETIFLPFGGSTPSLETGARPAGSSRIGRGTTNNGLGLAVSRRLVERMGGTIEVSSIVGQGSVFTVRLPVGLFEEACSEDHSLMGEPALGAPNSAEAALLAATTASANPTANGQAESSPPSVDANPAGVVPPEVNPNESPLHTGEFGVTGNRPVVDLRSRTFDPEMGRRFPLEVLVADDVAVNQKLLASMLERFGYHADVVADGRQALDALAAKSYDLVMLDIHMPVMDGVEAARQIARAWPETRRPRLVAVTANARGEESAAWMNEGFVDILSKPIQPHELAETLERTGRWARKRRATPEASETDALVNDSPDN